MGAEWRRGVKKWTEPQHVISELDQIVVKAEGIKGATGRLSGLIRELGSFYNKVADLVCESSDVRERAIPEDVLRLLEAVMSERKRNPYSSHHVNQLNERIASCNEELERIRGERDSFKLALDKLSRQSARGSGAPRRQSGRSGTESVASPSRVATETRLLVSVVQAGALVGLGRTAILQRIYSGEIPSVMVGKRRLVPVEGLHEWVSQLTR